MFSLIFLGFLFIFLLFLLAVLFYLIYTSFIQPGAVYYPTTYETAEEMVKAAKAKTSDVVMDLGSGDGRLLIAFAKKGIRGIGYEIDPLLVLESRRKISKERLDHLIVIHHKSFWKADFNEATIIVLYLFPHFMDRLEKILMEKLKHSLLLISNTYQFPKRKYNQKLNKLFLYNFP